MCMFLVRLGHYYLVYLSITCSWLCCAACDATWILLSFFAHEMDASNGPAAADDGAGVSGNLWWALTTPQKKKKTLLVGSFTSSLNWLFLLVQKRGPNRNRHVPVCVSLPNLWIVIDRWWPPFQTYTWRHRWCPARPGPPGSHRITKGAHTCLLVENYSSCISPTVYTYICMYDELHFVRL